MNTEKETLGPCPICGRTMIAGPSVNEHHWVPKSEGGSVVSTIHKICHRMIHELFSEAELAGRLATPEALRAEPALAKFIAWVRKKPADYVDWPKSGSPRKRRKKPSPIVYPTGR